MNAYAQRRPLEVSAWVWNGPAGVRAKRLLAALALLAIAVLLLRPVCEAFDGSHGAGRAVQPAAVDALAHAAANGDAGEDACCARIGPAAVVGSSEVPSLPYFGSAFAAASQAFLRVSAISAEARRSALDSAAPSRPYYARSLRILR